MKIDSFLPRLLRVRRFSVSALIAATAITSAFAKPVPANLGNGLADLVESNLVLKGKLPAPKSDNSFAPNGKANINGKSVATYNGYGTARAAAVAPHAITDVATNKVMVDIVLGGK